MKQKYTLALLFTLFCATGFGQQNSTFHIRVIGADPGDRMALYETDAENKLVEIASEVFPLGGDTLTLHTGKSDRMFRLFFEPEDGRKSQMMLFAENGKKYTVSGFRSDFHLADISGGLYEASDMKALEVLTARRDSLAQAMSSLSSQKENPDRALQTSRLLDDTDKALVSAKERFIAYHPESSYSAFLVTDLMASIPRYTTLERVRRLYNSLNGGARNTYSGERANEQVYALLAASEGAEVPRFVLTSTAGDPVAPDHFRGKWLVLDFWASWCKPCRESNPDLVELYRKYHDKGLEVVGIASWDTQEAWKKAIEQDSLPWIQVNASEKVSGQQDLTRMFVITGVPTVLLIDRQGKIVFRGNPGDLHKKLEEVLGE